MTYFFKLEKERGKRETEIKQDKERNINKSMKCVIFHPGNDYMIRNTHNTFLAQSVACYLPPPGSCRFLTRSWPTPLSPTLNTLSKPPVRLLKKKSLFMQGEAYLTTLNTGKQ